MNTVERKVLDTVNEVKNEQFRCLGDTPAPGHHHTRDEPCLPL